MTECRRVTTIQAVLTIRGRTGDSRIRGQVRAALARPSLLRLEGVAPFGRLGWVLAAGRGTARLVLPRERQVVTDEDAAELLAALTGLTLGADDLRAVLTGCVAFDARPVEGRAYPDGWMVVDTDHGERTYLRSVDGDVVVVAGTRDGLRIEYSDHVRGLPRRVEVRTTDSEPATELTATMSQVSLNVTLDPQVFVAEAPEDYVPITLDDLRQSQGPLEVPSRPEEK